MTQEQIRLHGLIQYLELIGSWGMAEILRDLLLSTLDRRVTSK